jgi:EAL domain-containing protein (putative c-di-GMP-specific phosphodiesterase class I)
MISPDEFISVAENTGIILEIGDWVMQEASAQLAIWHANGNCKQGNFRLAVNVSTRQFRQQHFVEHVLDTLNKFNVPPECIELEITESLLMDDLSEVVYKMMALRSHGIRISIDDFGTGYSSLSYLTQLPIDQLKIDKSFIRDLVSDSNDIVVVETIISMANHLGLNVIAEGVENGEQLQFLNGMGCNLYQGYYFSRPIGADEFSILMTRGIQTFN